MAITGTGTQADPYLVHSYDDIKEQFAIDYGDSTTRYIKLANDIDCNNYSVDFEWETVTTFANTISIDFDLDGHTIKNVKVKSGANRMFDLRSYALCKIHNGKLLNIFLGGATGLAENVTFEKISISADVTAEADTCFEKSVFNACAVYLRSSDKVQKAVLHGTAGMPESANSDFMFKIASVYDRLVNNMKFNGCRFNGEIGSAAKTFFFQATCANCINNIAYLNTDTITLIGWSPSNCLENITRSRRTSAESGTILATDEQMKNSAWLNANGFIVVEVGD